METNATVNLRKTIKVSRKDVDMADLLTDMRNNNASDLFLSANERPCFRIGGTLKYIRKYPLLYASDTHRLIYSLLQDSQKKKIEEDLELDSSFTFKGIGRFRMNVFWQRGTLSTAIRFLPNTILPLENLGLTPEVVRLTEVAHGLILVTGATGSGKSTTLAAMVNRINRNYAKHIITLEDPIEFVYKNIKSFIDQREIHSDSRSFANALKHVLRQNPDVVVVGEMRDPETVQIALRVAETGHLVFGTLHTNNCIQTIHRVIDMFPADQQNQIRSQLSLSLEGVICQTLVPGLENGTRHLAAEVMFMTTGLRNKIRQNKVEQMYSDIQLNRSLGSVTMTQSLAKLYLRNRISLESAQTYGDPDRVDELMSIIRDHESQKSVKTDK